MIQTRGGRSKHAVRPSDGGAVPDGGEPLFGFRPVNFGLLAAGVAAVAAGYALLGGGSTIAAPLLLVFGYAVCIPAGLLVGLKDRAPRNADRGE